PAQSRPSSPPSSTPSSGTFPRRSPSAAPTTRPGCARTPTSSSGSPAPPPRACRPRFAPCAAPTSSLRCCRRGTSSACTGPPRCTAPRAPRPAECTARHLPAFMRDVPPATWLAVDPFVRSYDWYLLPEEGRRTMLAAHGIKGRDYPQVLANTVSAFSLGDYE